MSIQHPPPPPCMIEQRHRFAYYYVFAIPRLGMGLSSSFLLIRVASPTHIINCLKKHKKNDEDPLKSFMFHLEQINNKKKTLVL